MGTLNRVFDHPRIACHHDFAQTQFDVSRFTPNVHFVQPHVETRWGDISLVKAMLEGLRLLYQEDPPDWFYLLSGSDYPLRGATEIIDELASSPYDAYIRLKKVDHTRVPERAAVDSGGLDSATYPAMAYDRYIARSIPIPSLSHPHRRPVAGHIHIRNPKLLKPFHPFTEAYQCYAGDQWFVGNSKTAAVLLSPGEDNKRLLRYFNGRVPPDEAYCPTVLGNAHDLNVSTEMKHYIRWIPGKHPRMLDETDLPQMLASNAHFARKFAPDAPVLDLLDAHLGLSPL